MDDAELDAVGRHLADCPACCDRLAAAAADPMVARLRVAVADPGEELPGRAEAVRAIRAIRAGLLRSAGPTAVPVDTLGPGRHRAGPMPAGRVGEYDLLEEVGRGGMGVVYRARHRVLNRPGAVKMILAGRFASEADRLRFRLEAELAARVRHPHVVPVYEVGEQDGCPFLAMEWVAGGSLADRLDDRPWPAAAAAELVETVALAVQAAHDEGVVHRDLKPANILLGIEDWGLKIEDWGLKIEDLEAAGSGLQSSISNLQSSIPKVADFGLARAVDGPGLTLTGVAAGTPEYMAPEQATGGRAAVGPGTDVYAVGVILYRLLTGRTPFAGDDPLAVLAAVAGREPPRLRRLNPAVPRDLEAVCLKCLEKKPHRRYDTARELAADLARFRAGRPVAARRVGAAARAARWGRRNPGTAGLLTALAAAIVVGFGLVTWKWREADGLRQVADDRRADAEASATAADARRREARRNLYVANVRLAKRAVDTAQLAHARELLVEAAAGEPGDDDLRGFEWHYLHRLAHPAARTVARHPAGIFWSAVSPDGRLVAACGPDATLRVTAVADGREVFAVRPPAGAQVAAFAPDGRRLAVDSGAEVLLLDTRTWEPAHRLAVGGGPSFAVVFHPDGRRLAVATQSGGAQIWDAETGRRVAEYRPDGHPARGLAYSPDGRHLAVGGADGVVRLCDPETGTVGVRSGPTAVGIGRQWVAYRPDGRLVAVGAGGGAVRLLDPDTGADRPGLPEAVPGGLRDLAFGPGGGVLAAAGGDGTVRVWEVGTGRLRLTLKGHTESVTGVAVTADGRVITTSQDRTVVEWDPAGSAESVALGEAGGLVAAVAWSPDGRRVAAAEVGGGVRVWADAGGEPAVIGGHQELAHGLAFGPGGRLATTGNDLTGRVWEPGGGRPAVGLVGHTAPPCGVAFAPDGRRVATGGYDATVRLWDAAIGRPERTMAAGKYPVHGVAFSPDGRHVAAAAHEPEVRVWEADTGRPVAVLAVGCGAAWAVAYSPDGRHLAAVGEEGAEVREADTGRLAFALRGVGGVRWVSYSADGRRLLTAGQDGAMRVWDAADGRELLALDAAGPIVSPAFSPDGRLAAGVGGTVRVWEAFPLPPDLLRRRRLTD